jgi:hypothetical protein
VHTLATSWSHMHSSGSIWDSGSCNGRRVRSRVNGNVVVMARTSRLSLHVLFLVVVPRALGSVGCLATQVTVVVGLVHARPPRANVVLALLVHNTVRRVGRMHTSRMLDKVARATRHPTGQQANILCVASQRHGIPPANCRLTCRVCRLSSPPSDTKRNFKNAAKHHSGRHLNSPTDFAPNHPHPHASVAAPWQVVHPTPQPSCFAGPAGPANTGWDASVVWVWGFWFLGLFGIVSLFRPAFLSSACRLCRVQATQHSQVSILGQ